jgi:hypothetical protein
MPEACLRHDTIGAFLRCRFTPRLIGGATIGATPAAAKRLVTEGTVETASADAVRVVESGGKAASK